MKQIFVEFKTERSEVKIAEIQQNTLIVSSLFLDFLTCSFDNSCGGINRHRIKRYSRQKKNPKYVNINLK